VADSDAHEKRSAITVPRLSRSGAALKIFFDRH